MAGICRLQSNVCTQSSGSSSSLYLSRSVFPFLQSRPAKATNTRQSGQSNLHTRTSTTPIPSPTPFVPDVPTFLSLIGRKLSSHASKFPDWKSLFSYKSKQLRELGLDPPRDLRYLLWWRDRFRKGITGPGGDLQYVDPETKEAIVRVVNVIKESNDGGASHMKAMVINVPKQSVPELAQSQSEGGAANDPPAKYTAPVIPTVTINPNISKASTSTEKFQDLPLKPVAGVRIQGARTITGPFVSLIKGTSGSVARIKAEEAMWEVKRGEKVDGGERRKVQVRRKRLLEARRMKRD